MMKSIYEATSLRPFVDVVPSLLVMTISHESLLPGEDLVPEPPLQAEAPGQGEGDD